MELQKGSVVRSRAGHDLGEHFVVVDIKDSYVFICDGRQRPLENPKRKNPLHIAKTNTILTSEQMRSNSGLRKALRPFNENSAKTSLKGGN